MCPLLAHAPGLTHAECGTAPRQQIDGDGFAFARPPCVLSRSGKRVLNESVVDLRKLWG